MNDETENDNVRTLGREFKQPKEVEAPTQLNKFRNVRTYLESVIGKQWLLAYINEKGQIVYFPNEELAANDTVFLAEFIKTMTFSQGMVVSPEE